MEERATYSASSARSVAKVIAERQFIYRVSMKKFTGSLEGAILLQQIIYWWERNNGEPFYKFFEPCTHEFYRPGDSWLEELDFSHEIVTTALKSFAKKITKGVSKNEMSEIWPVVYWTDSNRVTWYRFNPETFNRLYSPYLDNHTVSDKPFHTDYPTDCPVRDSFNIDDYKDDSSLRGKNQNNGLDQTQDEPLEDGMNKQQHREGVIKALKNGVEATITAGVEDYPADVRDVVDEVCKAWNLRPPRKCKTGGPFSFWIEGARELVDSCGEFGCEPIRSYRKRFEKYMSEHQGVALHTVTSPKSLVNMIRAEAGLLRQKAAETSLNTVNVHGITYSLPPGRGEVWMDGQRVR